MSRILSIFAALAAVSVLTLSLGCASTVEEAEQMDVCAQQAEGMCAPGDNACYNEEYADCMEAAGFFVR